MSAAPAPGLQDPVHDAQQAFRAALEALSRPGRIQHLGLSLPDLPLPPALAALLLTLTDDDTPVWWQQPSPPLQQWLRFHTGARSVGDPAGARFAVITLASEVPDLRHFPCGSLEAPGDSCTLLMEVPSPADGVAVQAHGPGIAGAVELRIAGLPDSFWAQWLANHAAFPQGVDVFFTCGDAVLGLPRTTRIGRLQEVQPCT